MGDRVLGVIVVGDTVGAKVVGAVVGAAVVGEAVGAAVGAAVVGDVGAGQLEETSPPRPCL